MNETTFISLQLLIPTVLVGLYYFVFLIFTTRIPSVILNVVDIVITKEVILWHSRLLKTASAAEFALVTALLRLLLRVHLTLSMRALASTAELALLTAL